MLDQTKIKGSKRISWQVINVVAPVAILILAAFLIIFLRRLRYRSMPKSHNS
jgi:hypothetical protein